MDALRTRAARRRLANAALTLVLIQAIGAVAGGLALMVGPRGEIIPLKVSTLAGSPFDTFFVPGLVLFSVLGLGPLLGALLIWLGHPIAPFVTVAVGGALLIWLSVQIAIIGYSSDPPIQLTYIVLGIVITVVGLAWLAAERGLGRHRQLLAHS